MQAEQSNTTRRWIQIQVIIWAAFVILLYYIHDNNWLEDFRRELPYIAEMLWAHAGTKVVWALCFTALGYGMGKAVLRIARLSSAIETIEDDITFSIATGWGLLGIGAFLLGVIGLLHWWLHLGIGIALFALTLPNLLGLFRRLRQASRGEKPGGIEALLLLTIVTIAIWGLGVCFQPEYGPNAYSMYLGAPHIYLSEGRISFHPEISFNSSPQTVEMWFMESLMLIPEGAGTFLMAVCRLLAALVVFSMTRRFFGRGSAVVAAAIYLLTYEVYRLSTMSYIDHGLNLMLLLGIYATLIYLEKPSRNHAILAGLMFGFACGISYLALVSLLIVAIIAVAFALWFKHDLRAFTSHFGPAAVILIVICSPWYVRNLSLFHNPFFPFFTHVFPTASGPYAPIAGDLAVNHREMLRAFAPETGESVWRFLTLPMSIAFRRFSATDPNAGAIGPWTVIALPFALLLKRFPRILWPMAAFVVLSFAWWWFVEGVLVFRYILPVFALTAAISGYIVWEGLGLERFSLKTPIAWAAAAILFAVLVGFFAGPGTPSEIRGRMHFLPAVRNRFTARFFPIVPTIRELNRTFRDEGILDEVRVYGFDGEQYRWFADFTIVGSRFGYADYYDYLAHYRTAEELHEWLREYDVDYLFINSTGASLLAEELNRQAIPRWLEDWEEYFERVPNEQSVHVYRLK